MTQAVILDQPLPARPTLRMRIGRIRIRMLVATAILVALGMVAALANVIAPESPSHANLADALTSPQWLGGDYILGTDQIGRDILSRLMYGLRTSLLVGVLSVIISASIGITLGLIAGYMGSIVDTIIMRLVDFQMSVPGILLVVVLAFVIGPGLQTTIIVLGIAGWVAYARMSRAEVRVVNSQPYVLAAQSLGCSPVRIALRHTFPNSANTLIVLSVLQFGGAIIAEASISFLGFGVQSPGTSLGIMVSDGRKFINVAWWMPFFPGMVLFVLVLAVNLIGEALQDWMDPVRRRR